MKRYPSYKPSGISWIGEIPSHWQEASIGHIFDIVAGGDAKPEIYSYEKDSEHPHPVYANTKDENATYAFTSKPLFGPNAITVTGRGDIGRAFYRDHLFDAIVRLLVLSPRSGKIDGRYYAYFINSIQGITSDSAAIGQLSTQQLYPFKATIPPLDEQKKIVEFLSTKTSLIDAQQRERERELRLLDELKQAKIANVVTRGLNPDVPMKHSGIPWIGQIPAHWDVQYLFQFAKEHHISNKEVHHQNLLSLSYGRIIRKDINTTDGLLPESFDTYQVVEPGNIILRLTDLQNDHKSLRVGLVNETGIITSAYVCLEINDAFIPEYFYNLLHSYDLKKVFYSMGGGLRQNLNYQGLRKLEIVLPPIEEQKAIVEYIANKNNAIDEMIANLRAEIDFLTEYKQRLIADVVTGQINVGTRYIASADAEANTTTTT